MNDRDSQLTGDLTLAAGIYGKEKEYWINKLSGGAVKSVFPYDHDKIYLDRDDKAEDEKFEMEKISFGGEFQAKLMKICKKSDYTLHMLLAAGLTALLGKYTGNNDIVIGTPIYKQDMEGEFLNTALALRNQLAENMIFKELLLQVRQTIVEANEHQNYPLETLLYHLNMTITGKDFPLFEIVILLENIHEKKYIRHTHPNIIFSFLRDPGKVDGVVEGTLEYNPRLYHQETIERIIRHYICLLEEAVSNIDGPLSLLAILSEAEKEKLLIEFNETQRDYPAHKTIAELFEEQVKKSPQKTAVVNEEECLTYEMLAERSGQLAYYLLRKGIKGEEIIGIMTENSPQMIVGILAILKAGGAYLPLNPDYPEERRKYLVKDGNAGLLLITDEFPSFDPSLDVETIHLCDSGVYEFPGIHWDQDRDRLTGNHSPNSPAYIIYTSGSAGNPKGVIVEHRSVVRLVKNTNIIELNEEDRLLQTGALDFDASTFEIWGSLLNGLTLYLAKKETILTPARLEETVRAYGINTMWLTAPLFNRMVEEKIEIFSGLRNLIVGGDVLSPVHINRVKRSYRDLKLINGYGPTENTTFSITHTIEGEYKKNIPIGKPIANSTAYILDKSHGPVPIGAPGELYLGGDGLARGYLNNPELTAEKFGPQITLITQINQVQKTNKSFGKSRNPFSKGFLAAGGILYRTGDLARWLPDGNIEFLGRIDYQVKIRGYRIEPGEIENRLKALNFIADAVVTVRENSGEKYLCAYVASRENKQIDMVELRNILSANLPDYMIPPYFVQLEKIPLTPNGKCDRKALPEPGIKTGVNYVAPRDETEKKLVEIWAGVLQIAAESLGIDDDFFLLGGHSLKATILVSRLHKGFDVKVPLAKIFQYPTIRELARYITARYITTDKPTGERFMAIEPVEKKKYYPTTPAQKRMYILQQMDKRQMGYNVPAAVILSGNFHKDKIAETFKKLIHRHESLRTSFYLQGEQLVQELHDAGNIEFAVQWLAHDELQDIYKHFVRPFDLATAPLIRVGMGEWAAGKYLLAVDMHHIITDGTSLKIFVKEFMDYYTGKEPPDLKLQYKDFAQWQLAEQQKETFKSQENYWLQRLQRLQQFHGELPVLNLPTDYLRPPVKSFAGNILTFELSAPHHKTLKEFSFQTGATLYMTLLAIYTLLLARLSGQEEIIIGTPTAGRRHADLKNIIGMFVNTLIMTNVPGVEKTVSDFLQEVKDSTLEAFENQDYPFEDLVEKLEIKRDAGRNPIFDVGFSFHNEAQYREDGGYLEYETHGVTSYELENPISKFDLALTGLESGDKLQFSFEYSTALFKKETVEGFGNYFIQAILNAVSGPLQKIGELDIIPAAEKEHLLYHFNDTAVDYPREKTIHLLFEEQAGRTPDCIAVIGSSVETLRAASLQITYRQLNGQSGRLAGILVEKGILAKDIVAINMAHSIEMIIAILAILKAGAAYLPIDANHPRERIDYMLKDSAARILLNKSEIRNPKSETNSNDQKRNDQNKNQNFGAAFVLNFEHLNFDIVSDFDIRISDFNSSNLAYIIYTSGTTGRPKGVPIEHRQVINTLLYRKEQYRLDTNITTLQLFSYSFDGFVTSFFTPIISGARVVLNANRWAADIERIKQLIVNHRVNQFICVPALYEALIDTVTGRELNSLQVVVLAGDRLSPGLVEKTRQKNPALELAIEYGVTECSVMSTLFRHQEREKEIKIGKPTSNTQVYILAVKGGKQLQPIGTAGELCIAGAGVARGYLNKPELTAEKFISPSATKNPFEKVFLDFPKLLPDYSSPFTFYKTGDLARWLPDGNIEFLGRIDHQVKIRGFRIELGEIENRLSGHQEINEAVVTVVENENGWGDKCLCAYITGTREFGETELRDYLGLELPGYMIPAYFVQLNKMPLTVNGKLDRRALPAPLLKTVETYTVPADEIEEKIVEIWSGVLGVKKEVIGVQDNFFHLGGHSLKATVLASWLSKAFNVEFPLTALFKGPTVREMADAMRRGRKSIYEEIKPVEKKEYYPLSSAQKRLFFMEQLENIGVTYNMPSALKIEGKLDRGQLEYAVAELIRLHEALRTSFHLINHEPVQIIHETVDFKIEYYHYGDSPLPIIKEFVRPFELSLAPLFHMAVVPLSPDEYLLLYDFHHIIGDGTSMGILGDDFTALYNGRELPPLKIHYKDFSAWQNNLFETGKIEKQVGYWLECFSGQIPVLNLPTDYPRPASLDFAGKTIVASLEEGPTSALKRFCLESGVTLYMNLLAALNVLFYKYTHQCDMVVGTAIMGRPHADLHRLIGMFVNSLGMRNFPDGEKRYPDFLREVKETCLNAFENQDVQLEWLADRLKIKRNPSRNPFFDILLVVQNFERSTTFEHQTQHAPGELKFSTYPMEIKTSKFDLNFSAWEEGNTITFNLEYATKMFAPSTARKILSDYFNVLGQLIKNKDTGLLIMDVDILSEDEKKRLLVEFNDTAAPWPKDKTVYGLFEGQVEKNPDHIAIIDLSAGAVTYRECDRKVNRLANYLSMEKNIRADHRVGLLMDKSIDCIVAILAIQAAGGAYVPIDPGLPEERIVEIIEDADIEVVISEKKYIKTLNRIQWICRGLHTFLCMDSRDVYKEEEEQNGLMDAKLWEYVGESAVEFTGKVKLKFQDDLRALARQSSQKNMFRVEPHHLLYIIYTSGTTGKPKGVMIEHRNVVRLMTNHRFLFDFNNLDVWTMFHSTNFDFSVWEMYGALLYGGKLVIIPRMTARDISEYLTVLVREGVTILNQTPSAFYRLMDEESGRRDRGLRLRYVIFGGEALSPGKIKSFNVKYPGVKLVNMYGITETTVHVTFKEITSTDIGSGVGNIGKPIPTLRVYIMDRDFNLAPVGAAGELYVGGDGVARGYLNRPELTCEKFKIINDKLRGALRADLNAFDAGECQENYHPSSSIINHSILYRTGDLGRYLSNGDIEYLGRSDHQVKIRGFRLELGEIESRLRSHGALKEAVVMARDDGFGDLYLCAYVVSASGEDKIDTQGLKEYLKKKIPDYMIPAYFVSLAKIPLTSNGKVDLRALPEPAAMESGVDYIAPRDNVELKLGEIWSEVLKKDLSVIGIDDDFFELGGHSLRATAAASNIHKELNIKVPLAEIFKTPTIRALARYIKGKSEEKFLSIPPVEEMDYYALSPAQKRLYILQQMKEGNTGYNEYSVLELVGRVDKIKLEEIFKKLIARHESFRTYFVRVGADIVQRIAPIVEFCVDYSEVKGEDLEGIVSRFVRPFDLEKAPLLRVGLVRFGKDRYWMIYDMHHIITDGISMTVLTNEFAALYAGEWLEPMRIQYKDFSQWQNGITGQEALKRQESYWLREFREDIPVLALTTDFPRPAVQGFAGDRLQFHLGAEETGLLNACRLKQDVTLFMLLLGAYNVLLSRLSGQEDIVVGTPIAGRRHADLQQVIGMFVNTLALRNYPGRDRQFNDFLREIKQRTLEAFENQEYPFEALVEKVTVQRAMGRNPLFDMILAVQNMEVQASGIPTTPAVDLQLKQIEFPRKISKFDLSLHVNELGEELLFTLEYSTALFKKETVERFYHYFIRVALAAAADPLTKINEIEIMSAGERERILYHFNDTAAEYPREKTVNGLFEEQVERTPDRIAVIGYAGSVGQVSLSYSELNEQSNRLARRLNEEGLKTGDIAAVMMSQSVDLIVGIMGILKTGAAYLPIDPNYPQERIDYILKDSNARILIIKSEARISKSETNPNDQKRNDQNKNQYFGIAFVLNFEHLNFDIVSNFDIRISDFNSSNLAYLIYTSGTTGVPRGVLIGHRSLINLCYWHNRYYNVNESDRAVKYAGIGFDASVWEIFPYLLTGASLCIIDEGIKLDIAELNRYFERQGITIAFLPTQVCEQFIQLENRSLRKLLTGGDKLRHFKKKRYEVYNNYGPTENTVVSTACLVEEYSHNIPIGKPTANTGIYIVAPGGMNHQPVGVPGELCVGGDGLSRGYVNNPELTCEKFKIKNEKLKSKNGSGALRADFHHSKLYYTGDLARWLEDGNIEFLGRIDFQVKVRGNRIELGEIEALLLKHEKIKDAVVTAMVEGNGDTYLCAYIVSETETATSVLREYLEKHLPGYMIPSHFILIDRIPLTPNGKVDRAALPAPIITAGQNHVAPRDNVEDKLADIWAEVLGVDKSLIGIDSDFFDLGGHSLKATIAVSKIHMMLDVKVPLPIMFRNASIRELGGYIKTLGKHKYAPIDRVEVKEYYDISHAQKRLWIIEQMKENQTAYNIPITFQLEGILDIHAFERAFLTLVHRHEALRTVFITIDGEPKQKIIECGDVDFKLNYIDARNREKPFESARDLAERQLRTGFNLEKGPLLRVNLVHIEGEKYVFQLILHHIISDGWSMNVLFSELMNVYINNGQGEPTGGPMAPLRIQYKDYTAWQNNQVTGPGLNPHREYWLRQFRGEIPVIKLPTDKKRPAVKTFNGNRVDFIIDTQRKVDLDSLGHRMGTGLFMTLLAAVNALLRLYTGQEDIVTGSPVAGRQHIELENQVGFYVNTLPIRIDMSGLDTFNDLLQKVKQTSLEAYEYQAYPFDLLVEELGITNDPGRNPLFDVMVVLQNNDYRPYPIPDLRDLHISSFETGHDTSTFELNFHFTQLNDRVLLNLVYDSDLFEELTIQVMGTKLLALIGKICSVETIRLNDITHDSLLPVDKQKIDTWDIEF